MRDFSIVVYILAQSIMAIYNVKVNFSMLEDTTLSVLLIVLHLR